MSEPDSNAIPCLSDEELGQFVNGRVPLSRLSEIELHLQRCERCASLLAVAPADRLVQRLSRFAFQPAPDASDSSPPVPWDGDSRYELLEELGRGGMGQVFRARHRLMKRIVAIKTIRPELLNHPDAVRRFAKETRAAARLSHPNIVSAFDAGLQDNSHFLVMEYVDGEPLNHLVNRQGPLPAEQAVAYVRQAALGLQHAYEQNMVHRDIKPHNLMLTRDGTVKILDFGLSKFRPPRAENSDTESLADETVLTLNDTQLGTEGYVAPEQVRDARAADVRSDLYSLGCTLFFLLTNRPPFHGLPPEDPRALPDVRPFRSDLPESLCRIVDQLIQHDPAARYQSPQQLIDALDAWCCDSETGTPEMPQPSGVVRRQQGRDPSGPPALSSPATRQTPAGRRRWLGWAVAAGIAAAALLLLWIYARLN